MKNNIAKQKRIVAAFLCYILGMFGGHRFYVGKNESAITMLLILVGGVILSIFSGKFFILSTIISSIWVFIDFVLILSGKFTNVKGEKLIDWT